MREIVNEELTQLPKGYKMTELGLLPKEWQVVRLGKVADVKSGGSAPQGDTYFGGKHPFIRVQHLDEDGFFVRRWDLITDEAVKKYRLRLFPAGTIVFPKSGASIRLEKRALLPLPAYLVSHLCAVIPRGKNPDRDFLFYTLKNRRLAAEKAEGYPTLTLTEIKRVLIPLPPLPEQRAIAYVLRKVQEAKEATERVITALRQLKKSLMRYLFTYGPVPLDQAEQVTLKETEIGLIPEHWQVVKTGQLIDAKVLLARNGFPQGQYNQEGEGVPHLRPFNITNDGTLDLSQIKYVASPSEDDPHWLRYGDVIFNNTNSEELVGKTAFFDQEGRFVLSNHMTLIRVLKPNVIDAYWLANLLHFFWHLGLYKTLCRRHVNQASISLERLRNIQLPIPPLSEQQQIAAILQEVDRRIEAEEAYRRALDELFKTLLHDLMTAKRRLPSEFIAQFEGREAT